MLLGGNQKPKAQPVAGTWLEAGSRHLVAGS
jgi:hypothetical protein